jgi:hypothetical protein
MVQDAVGDVAIVSVGAPHAAINAIRILDQSTGTWYNIYPEGQTAQVNQGAGMWMDMGVGNNGNRSGVIYIIITRTDTNQVVLNDSFNCAIGVYVTKSVNFTMPANNVNLHFEIGHS